MEKLKLYIVVYNNEYGIEAYLVMADHFPRSLEVAERLKLDYLPDTKAESLEVFQYTGIKRIPVILKQGKKGPRTFPMIGI